MSGIDGIGKRGGGGIAHPEAASGAAGAPGAAAKTNEPATSFREVSAAARANPAEATTAASQVGGSTPLEQLRAGKVDMNGYLDLKVDEATRGLKGLPKVELDTIRQVLREQLSSDPGLADLVQKATGAAPPAPPNEGE